MEAQPNILISLYQEERQLLEHAIRESLAELDYLNAHYNQQALYQVQRRLRTLHNIDDRLYDRKHYLRNSIRITEEEMLRTDSDLLRDYFSSEIALAKDALEKISQTPDRSPATGPDLLFENVLNRLLDGEVNGVKLMLKNKDNFFFAFSYSNKKLQVKLPHIKTLLKKWVLNEPYIDTFKKMGFVMTANENTLILTISGSKEKIVNRTMLILSKIVFDMFYFIEFENQSYIHYREKPEKRSHIQVRG
jgi:hypothetical protein